MFVSVCLCLSFQLSAATLSHCVTHAATAGSCPSVVVDGRRAPLKCLWGLIRCTTTQRTRPSTNIAFRRYVEQCATSMLLARAHVLVYVYLCVQMPTPRTLTHTHTHARTRTHTHTLSLSLSLILLLFCSATQALKADRPWLQTQSTFHSVHATLAQTLHNEYTTMDQDAQLVRAADYNMVLQVGCFRYLCTTQPWPKLHTHTHTLSLSTSLSLSLSFSTSLDICVHHFARPLLVSLFCQRCIDDSRPQRGAASSQRVHRTSHARPCASPHSPASARAGSCSRQTFAWTFRP